MAATRPSSSRSRARQVSVLGSAEPGSPAYELAGAAGELVVSIVPSDDIHLENWPCSVLIPCGMGDARNLLMALAMPWGETNE